MFSTPVKSGYEVREWNGSPSDSEDGMVTPVKQAVGKFGGPRKATPNKPSGSANYQCFLDIAQSGWTEERSSELATVLMTQISAGRDINGARRSSGQTALFAVVKEAPRFIVQAFLNHGADSSVVDIYGRSVLQHAMYNPDYKVARLIWRQLASAANSRLLTEADGKGLTPLHLAFSSGNIQLIGYILLDAYSGAIQKQTDANGSNHNTSLKPLRHLIDAHQRNLLHLILETPWSLDQSEGVIIILEKLIELGVDRFAKDDRHRTPLKVLLHSSHTIRKTPPSPSYPSYPSPTPDEEHPDSPLELTSSISIATALLQNLTPREVDLSIMLMFKNDLQEWNNDWRPIQQVMQVGEFFVFLPLFVSRCSFEALSYVDTKNRTLWHYLANMGAQKNVIEYYAERFSQSENSPSSVTDPETGVSVPYLESHVSHIRTLVRATFRALFERVKEGDLLQRSLVFDADHQSPLHMAAKWNNVVAMSELYSAYGEESQQWRDASGATPLHTAVQFNAIFVLLELRSLGWQLNVEDGQGRTPYALAVQQNRKTCARLLKAWGADPGPSSPHLSPITSLSSPRDSDDTFSLDIEPLVPAGEAAGSRLSASIGNLPLFVDPPLSPPSTTRVATVIEDDEDDDDDDISTMTPDAIGAQLASISTVSLRSALHAAKIRDEDSAEELNLLKAEVAQLKLELASKLGEAKELESALHARPSIREYEEIKDRTDKTHRINLNLKETVDELRQKVIDLELAVADHVRLPSSGHALSDSQQHQIADHEARIHQLVIQLKETQNSLLAAQLEAERAQADSDILPQLRRQLDQAQAQLAQAVQSKLEADGSLRENEILVKKLYADLETMNSSLTEQVGASSPLLEEATRLIDEKELALVALKIEIDGVRAGVEERENELKAELLEMKAQSEAWEIEKKQKDALLEEFRLSIDALGIRCSSQAQEILKLTEEHKTSDSAAYALAQAGIDDMELERQKERQMLSDRLAEAENIEESLLKESLSLKSQLESQIRERETQSKSLELLEAATLLLRANESQFTSILEDLQSEMAELKRERAELLATNKTLISVHNTHLVESERILGENKASVSHLSEELASTRKELAEIVVQKDDLISRHHVGLMGLERQISELGASSNVFKEQLQESKMENERLRNTTSHSNIVDTETSYSSSPSLGESVLATLKDQLGEAKQEIDRLIQLKDAAFSESNTSLLASERKIGEMGASIALLTQNLSAAAQDTERLAKSNETLAARHLELERGISEFKGKSAQLEEQLCAYKKEREAQILVSSAPSTSGVSAHQLELETSVAEKNGIIMSLKEHLQFIEKKATTEKNAIDEASHAAIMDVGRVIGEIKTLLESGHHDNLALKEDIAQRTDQIVSDLVATKSALHALQTGASREPTHVKYSNGLGDPQGDSYKLVLAELKFVRSVIISFGVFLVVSTMLVMFVYSSEETTIRYS